jgi:hypothetical protein
MGLLTVKIWNFENVGFQLYILATNVLAIAFIYFKFGLWLESRRKEAA